MGVLSKLNTWLGAVEDAPLVRSQELIVMQSQALTRIPAEASRSVLEPVKPASLQLHRLQPVSRPAVRRMQGVCKGCGGPLTDLNSIAVGYGPRCAQVELSRLMAEGVIS